MFYNWLEKLAVDSIQDKFWPKKTWRQWVINLGRESLKSWPRVLRLVAKVKKSVKVKSIRLFTILKQRIRSACNLRSSKHVSEHATSLWLYDAFHKLNRLLVKYLWTFASLSMSFKLTGLQNRRAIIKNRSNINSKCNGQQ